ncbi:MAG: HEPN domain-containing protein [Firmicutes bacterium]|nr:HEPN domain-containing protein [Bacillota bacterium]
MSKHDLVKEWLQIARKDFESAQHLFNTMHPKPLEIVCYHCQQSAEKSLKAYLCAQDIDVPKTHEVALLCRLCEEYDNEFSKLLESCERLEIYATSTRYPSIMEIEEHNADKALQQALTIHDFVLSKIDLSGKQ